jgi:hypothetical protein
MDSRDKWKQRCKELEQSSCLLQDEIQRREQILAKFQKEQSQLFKEFEEVKKNSPSY